MPGAFIGVAKTVDAARVRLRDENIVGRIWAGDHTVWKPEPTGISDRLGWLHVVADMQDRVAELVSFADEVRKEGFTDAVVLGMGGSSLGAEALCATHGSQPGHLRVQVLDSTVPAWVRRVTAEVDPTRTLFLVASKSGTTLEVECLHRHFRALAEARLGRSARTHFVAVTDPETGLARQAGAFRRVFLNRPDVGGRFSVLSYFGLVPAALAGLDVGTLLERAGTMAAACARTGGPEDNPGAELGSLLGGAARLGRDKLTLVFSPRLAALGAWVEQLVAESTGKEGRGVLPVVGEPLAPPDCYGEDRLFVVLRLAGDRDAAFEKHAAALDAEGEAVVELRLAQVADLGAEFFRWEMATAVAGHLLGIQPFDQPDVEAAKANARRLLAGRGREEALDTAAGAAALHDALAAAGPGAYVAILAYTDRSPAFEREVATLRRRLLTERRLPTTSGYGPRYLHSTGQLHKGDAGRGIFLVLTADVAEDVPVPGEPYSFGALARAQAAGDLQALRARGRVAVHVALGGDPAAGARRLLESL